jgi:hypothetical protein
VCLSEPSLFWSAGEDGVVRQYDARTPDQKAYGSANVLVNLMSTGEAAGPRLALTLAGRDSVLRSCKRLVGCSDAHTANQHDR